MEIISGDLHAKWTAEYKNGLLKIEGVGRGLFNGSTESEIYTTGSALETTQIKLKINTKSVYGDSYETATCGEIPLS